MRRSALLKLREKMWVGIENDPMRCCVIPSAASGFSVLAQFGMMGDDVKDEFCRKVFVDFENYNEDDGTAIPNSLEARREIYDWRPAQEAITACIGRITRDAAEGEAVAVSV